MAFAADFLLAECVQRPSWCRLVYRQRGHAFHLGMYAFGQSELSCCNVSFFAEYVSRGHRHHRIPTYRSRRVLQWARTLE